MEKRLIFSEYRWTKYLNKKFLGFEKEFKWLKWVWDGFLSSEQQTLIIIAVVI
jgi:hypothetical protein